MDLMNTFIGYLRVTKLNFNFLSHDRRFENLTKFFPNHDTMPLSEAELSYTMYDVTHWCV
jgi:hypothetical protein